MDLTVGQLGALAAFSSGVAALALVLAVVAQLRVRHIQRSYRVLWGGGEVDLATLAAGQQERVAATASALERLRDEVAGLRAGVGQSLRNVAVVRYDAFGDMGGRLSFSCAVVDDDGDGLVISSIHARGESRTYAKGIVGGGSEVTLTPEEQRALAAARTGKDH